MFRKSKRFLLTTMVMAAVSCFVTSGSAQYSWQEPQAKVLPKGDLEWKPLTFEFKAGDTVRYIDFENGNDNNDGTKAAPWKHHPWDKNVQAKAAAHRGPTTYVFKRGVTYRGTLTAKESGQPGNPIRLTSDLAWGSGEARFYGSEQITSGWRKAAHPKMPEADKVWAIDLKFPVRTLWMTEGDKITRIDLARDPNWTESDPNDLMSEWYVWENPRWWTGVHKTKVGRHSQHLGIDTKVLTGSKEDYVGGTVWTEWGIVMGSPFPSKISAFDAKQKAVAFRGPWTWDALEKIIRGNRYHLEDRPQWLDTPGEFWFDRKGRGGGTLYVRLPDDKDPNQAVVEVGKEIDIISATKLSHFEISGLTFRFTNVGWEYNDPQWSKPYLQAGVFHLNGQGDDIVISNNTFEHVHMPVRVNVGDVSQSIGTIRVNDNIMRHTDHGAILIASNFEKKGADFGLVDHVEIMRNNLYRIGWRNLSGAHGHAIDIAFPASCEIAGNFLYRIAGWGISNRGGKPSGHKGTIPFTRQIVHHNRVEDPLLKSNDWGGIETWQGGPHYIYNNVSINPGGLMGWKAAQGNSKGTPRFGHAYYLDGSFKNYLFNNIAVGRNNTIGSPLANETGIQNIISFENTFANNTLFRFVEMTRQQKPDAGRFRYLGNIMCDVSKEVFTHAKSQENADPNAAHFSQGNDFAYDTIAYAQNVFYDIKGKFGLFEETGAERESYDDFKGALARAQTLSSDLGVMASKPPLADPENGDYRPVSDSAAIDNGVKPWVPWALYSVVGEWNFLQSNHDPGKVMDEHWFMTEAYVQRDDYMNTPRYPLQGVNIAADNYIYGQLEDWTKGALTLNGKDQYLTLELDPKKETKTEPTPKPAEQKPAAQSSNTETRDTNIGWAVITHPVRAKVGEKITVTVKSKQPLGNETIRTDLHWLKEQGWGGTNVGGGPGKPTGQPDTLAFTFVPVAKEGLKNFLVTTYRTPSGFAEKTAIGNANIILDNGEAGNTSTASAASKPKPAPAVPENLPTVDMDKNSFIVEMYFKTEAGHAGGTLVSKAADGTGYVLTLDDAGKPQLSLTSNGAATLTKATKPVNDGNWHHLLVEVDRSGGAVLFYIDGTKAGSSQLGEIRSNMSLSNTAPFLVGKGNNGAFLAATIDFLRVSRGTLADARTNIEELYAWQFDGPFLYDFTGAAPQGKGRDAGAIELK